MKIRKADLTLDLRGKVCPYPTLESRYAMDGLADGEVLEVISDYYPARQTIPDLAQDLGCECVLLEDSKDQFQFLITKIR